MSRSVLQRGYIALISTLVLSFVLTTLAILAGESGLRTAMNTIDLENRRIALHAARSCAHIALLTIAQDSSYESHGDTVRLSEELTCIIEETYEEQDNFVIRTQAMVGRSMSRIEIEGSLSSTSTPVITKRREF